MEIKTCWTCKYANVMGYNEPCKSCREISMIEGTNHKKWEPMKPEENSRPKPLPGAVPYYKRESSRIPESIRISFSDGSTAVYELHVDQPAPQIVESIKIIRRMKQGYVNQPMRRRRNRR